MSAAPALGPFDWSGHLSGTPQPHKFFWNRRKPETFSPRKPLTDIEAALEQAKHTIQKEKPDEIQTIVDIAPGRNCGDGW
jgi:hypothetical protein